MAKEPQGELARYAFGYSDKKPSLRWWIIQAIMVAVALYSCVSIAPAPTTPPTEAGAKR
jgi:hypothetical protein